MTRLTSAMKFRNMGVLRLVSGVFHSKPGSLPHLELKSPIARTIYPMFLNKMASEVTRENRSGFHCIDESFVKEAQAA